MAEVQHNILLKLSPNFEELFNGKFGTWKTDILYFKLKEDVKLICLIPYPVPKLHKKIYKKEVECLVLLGFIEKAHYSEWRDPYFAQLKHKSTRKNNLVVNHIQLPKSMKCSLNGCGIIEANPEEEEEDICNNISPEG